MSGLIFGPVTVGSSIQRVGVVPRCLVADSTEELTEIVKGGFSDDQFRLINYGIARDCYDGNFQPYLQDWIANDEARAWTARYIPIMRRVCDLLSMHLYKKGPIREIAGHPEATALLQQIYAANDFDSLMQLADRTSYITDSCAIEFVPNDGPDAMQNPVTMRIWDAAEFVPIFTSDDCLVPWAVATVSTFGAKKVARVFTAETICRYSSNNAVFPQQTVTNIPSAIKAQPGTGYQEDFGFPIPNYTGVLPFEFVQYERPRNSFWSGGFGLMLAHMNLHMNRRLSDLADQIIQWRPKGVLVGVKTDWNFPPNQKPGEYTRLESTGNEALDGKQAMAEFIAPDLGFTQYDWNDIQNYWQEVVEMLGVPASSIRMEQQGGTSGVAIMSEQLPLIERAEARQRLMAYYECKIAKKCLQVALAQIQNAQPADEISAMYAFQQAAIIQAALMDIDRNFRVIWPVMTKNRPGPDRNANDAFQLNFSVKSRAEQMADDLNIPLDEAVAKVQQSIMLINQENMLIAQGQAQIQMMMAPMMPEGENPDEAGDKKTESGEKEQE
ncbi:hypothetical protein UFOVP142_14 [uncultured Caudovirales phage]|uniref:Portal protein n=1 Tax=uncultured Caudovirales phage TaxID=2100421 RepID=A0A6J7XL53_9CAUD|nr:hypothetical protein UFOVP142_14 [uncultured Caudovirales phage]